jgi:hypothetical protein
VHRNQQNGKKKRAAQPNDNRKLHGSLRIDQTRLKTAVAFVPPKPKELEIATSIFIFRASLAQ